MESILLKQIGDGAIKTILNDVFTKDFEHGKFDLHLTRSLLATKDADKTGKLDLKEFRELWQDLQSWKTLFKLKDEDSTGSFNCLELREALEGCGYRVSNATFTSLAVRYCDKEGAVKFDDFVACLIKLKALCGIHKSSSSEDGNASFNLDQFIQVAMAM